MKRYYLAYGSNLDMGQMAIRCPDAVPIGTAKISGYRLLFRGSKTGSYLTIEPQEGSAVPVGVWEVSSADEKRLDRYEGFPVFYKKVNMKVSFSPIGGGRKRTVDAFVYIMNAGRPFGEPTARYVATCLNGYNNFNFDQRVIWRAIFETQEEMKNEEN